MSSEFPQVNAAAAHPIVAAGFGAFVSLVLARRMTPVQALIAWVAGFGCAIYLSPLIVAYWPWLANYERGVTFSVGVFGLQLTAIIFDLLIVIRENPRATASAAINLLLRRKAEK